MTLSEELSGSGNGSSHFVFNDLCVHIKVQRPSCTSQKKGVAGTVYRAGGGLGVGGGGGGGNVSHTQSTVKCPFNHSQKPPWFICAAAQIYISKHPSY